MTQQDPASPVPGAPEPSMDLRVRLRGVPVFAGELPSFDPTAVPSDPIPLFVAWIVAAIDAGVAEPHAMTIASADVGGAPSSRVVILKDVRDGGFEFATDARSRKAIDLRANPLAAASFYWQPVARQVRITGLVVQRPEHERDADFLARSIASRAAAFAVRPGEPLGSIHELRAAIAEAALTVDAEPDAVLEQWSLLALEPLTIEFWQGDPRRAHTRVVFRRDDLASPWSHGLVWP